MSDQSNAAAKPKTATTRATATNTKAVSDGSGAWFEGIENEDYPEIVLVGQEERLVAELVDSDWIPMKDKQGNEVDREVAQVVIKEGTTVTEKDEDGNVTKEMVTPGEIRSFWISSALLQKLWSEWDVQPGETFATFYKGKVEGRNNEYHKWFLKVDGKVKPSRRRRERQSAN